MRFVRILAGSTAAVVVVAVIVLELSALTIATRSARSTVEACVPVRHLEVTSITRPAIMGLVRGELRDVRVAASGVQVGALLVDRVDARLPAVTLGWGPADRTRTLVANVTISEEALTDFLDAAAPEAAEPMLTVTTDGLDVGDRRVPFTLRLRATLVDGDVQLVPSAGDPRLWSSLGLELDLEVPDPIELLAVRTGDGEVVVDVRVRLEPDGREPTCPDLGVFEP